jgi:hypothetical protein
MMKKKWNRSIVLLGIDDDGSDRDNGRDGCIRRSNAAPVVVEVVVLSSSSSVLLLMLLLL